jgi:predicted nucleotidyltransferase
MLTKIERVLKEVKEEIQILYGSRLKTILLYGSWARGNAGEDSDIDVVVVLRGDIIPGREIDRMIDIITEMNMKYNTLISVYPVSETMYTMVKSPLLLNIHKEGVPL